MKLLTRILPLVVTLLVLSSLPSSADSGVAITVGSIQVDKELKPGSRYSLPSFNVLNIGDQRQEYELGLVSSGDLEVKLPSAKWMEFEPRTFTLNAGESQSVNVKVRLPRRAQPGDYSALLEARMVNDDGGVHGGVATVLDFTVGESGWLETLRRQVSNFVDDNSLWLILGLGSALIFGTLKFSSRHLRFRLPFEPR